VIIVAKIYLAVQMKKSIAVLGLAATPDIDS
jgi:hypothetical protein